MYWQSHDINFIFGIELANAILDVLLRKTSGKKLCRFWDKLELHTAESDVDEPGLPLGGKLPRPFDNRTHYRHYRQSAKDLHQFYHCEYTEFSLNFLVSKFFRKT